MKKTAIYIVVSLFLSGCFFIPNTVSAYSAPRLVYLQKGDIQIISPETSQSFYDELKGKPRDYFIDSNQDFKLYINLLVPEEVNRDGRYSARVFSETNGAEEQIAEIDGGSITWQEFYNQERCRSFRRGNKDKMILLFHRVDRAYHDFVFKPVQGRERRHHVFERDCEDHDVGLIDSPLV